MHRLRLLIFFLFISIVISASCFFVLAEESLSFITYYPSPYGVYNELQLYPHSFPLANCNNSNTAGTIYFDSSARRLKCCDGLGNWMTYGGNEPWKLSGNNLYNENSGNVGIGTLSPQSKLEVNGSILFNSTVEGYAGSIYIPNSDLAVGGGADGIFSIRGRNFGSQLMTFGNQTSSFLTQTSLLLNNQNRRIGIGTNSPASTLHIYGFTEKIFLQTDNNPNNYSEIIFDNTFASGREYSMGNYAHNYGVPALRDSFFIRDNTAGANRFIIKPNGNTGIGANNPQALLHLRRANASLWIEGKGPDIKFIDFNAVQDTIRVGINHHHDGDIDFSRNKKNTGSNDPDDVLSEIAHLSRLGRLGLGADDPDYRIDVESGGAYCNGSQWKDASDRAYKKDIDYNFKYGLKTVEQLKPVYFVYKGDAAKKRQVGLIAQDVKEVIPELVEGEEGSYGLSYGQLTAVLVNSVKEQQIQINNLIKERDELLSWMKKGK